MKRTIIRLAIYSIALVTAACAPTATPTPVLEATAAPKPSVTPPAPTAAPTLSPVPKPSATTGPTPAPHLDGRALPAMAYDVQSKHVILFGGLRSWYALMTDTWALDPAAGKWTAMHPAQSPNGLGIMAYDNKADRIVLYAGSTSDSANANNLDQVAPLAETWAYDFETDTWTNRKAAGTPAGLIGASLVYDTESDRVILFGGADETKGSRQSVPVTDETWAYDYAANAWTKMNPATKPPARTLQAMAYDAAADRVIIFGGYPGTLSVPFAVEPKEGMSLNDTWAYDFNADTWTVVSASNAPAKRNSAAMIYDPVSKRDILVGGSDGRPGSGSLKDAWAFDSSANTWMGLGSAPQLNLQGMAFAEEAQVLVAYTGGSSWGFFKPALWLYSPVSNKWTSGPAGP